VKTRERASCSHIPHVVVHQCKLLSKGKQAHQQQNQTLQATNAYHSFLETLKTLYNQMCIILSQNWAESKEN
jgi:hypothetical protein